MDTKLTILISEMSLFGVACLPLQGSGKSASPRASPHGSPTPHHTPPVSRNSPTQEDIKLVSEPSPSHWVLSGSVDPLLHLGVEW